MSDEFFFKNSQVGGVWTGSRDDAPSEVHA
jgi:hypothetical protein